MEMKEGSSSEISLERFSPVEITKKYAGVCGFWQIRTFLILAMVKIPSAWQMGSLLFTATEPRDFWCAPPEHLHDIDVEIWKNLSHPKVTDHETGLETLNPCYIYDVNYTDLLRRAQFPTVARELPLQRCYRFQYDSALTIATKWDLVCDREILIGMSQFFYLLGILFGALISGPIIKRYGPRKVTLLGMLFQILFGVLTAFSPIIEVKFVMRFLVACSCSSMLAGSFIIYTDIVHSTAKTVFICCFENFWSLGIISLAIWSYIFPNWFELQIILSIPTFLILLLFNWVPDSPIWLLTRGRYSEAKIVLEEAAKLNSRDLPDLDFEKCLDFSRVPAPGTWFELIKANSFLKLAMLHVSWALTFITYYGSLVNLKSLADNLRILTVLAGVAEIFGVFLGIFLILKIRRKWLILSFIVISAGLLTGLCWIVPSIPNPKYTAGGIKVALALNARVATTTSYTLLFVSSAEVFGPHFRPVAKQSFATFAKILLLITPFVEATAVFGSNASLSTYGILLILIGICTLVFVYHSAS